MNQTKKTSKTYQIGDIVYILSTMHTANAFNSHDFCERAVVEQGTEDASPAEIVGYDKAHSLYIAQQSNMWGEEYTFLVDAERGTIDSVLVDRTA